jgi:hypothetical protein
MEEKDAHVVCNGPFHRRLGSFGHVPGLALSLTGTDCRAKERKTRRSFRPRGPLVRYIAEVEDVTPEVLKQDLEEGKTLLEIDQSAGTNQHASADALASALLAPIRARLDGAVQSGQLTAAQESVIYRGLHARMATLVTTPHPFESL